MNVFARLARLFSRSGREEDILMQAINHAKAKRPEQAIAMHNSLLKREITRELRARVLFNRALAHSSMKCDDLAQTDLEEVLAMPGVAENVQSAARAQLARVKKRGEA
jgi:lipoprotein NlpI